MWILASRGRPNNLKRFVYQYESTKASSPIMIRLDEDDPYLGEYKKIDYPDTFKIVIGPRARLGAAMAELYETYPDLDWYGLLADDLIPKTEYWDKKMIDAAGTKFIVGADDGRGKAHQFCHPIVGGDLVRAVGWFSLPCCTHFCVELPWKYLANRGDKRFRKMLLDVVVEHAHYRWGQAEKDQTYTESHQIKKIDMKKWDAWYSSDEWNQFLQSAKTVIV